MYINGSKLEKSERLIYTTAFVTDILSRPFSRIGSFVLGQTWIHKPQQTQRRVSDIGGGQILYGRQASQTHTQPYVAFLDVGANSSAVTNYVDIQLGWLGELAYVNVWEQIRSVPQILQMWKDCTVMSCGKVLQGIDWRSGTRGLTIKWPSGLLDLCMLFLDSGLIVQL